jgi:hypothetical protein
LSKEDVDILLRKYDKNIEVLRKEKTLHDKESIYHEVIGDLSTNFSQFREITFN